MAVARLAEALSAAGAQVRVRVGVRARAVLGLGLVSPLYLPYISYMSQALGRLLQP